MIKKIVVNHDVIFDELSSWYNPKQNVETDEDNENEDRNKFEHERNCNGNENKVGQQSPTSITCTGQSENSGNKSKSNAWSGKNVRHKKYDDKKGKQKMPEYEMLDEGSRNMEDLDSDASLDEELGTEFFTIPGVERAMKDAKSENEKIR